MNVELLKIYLDEWTRRSNHFTGGPAGFPKRSVGLSTGGYQSSLDDFSDQLDNQIMVALDTIIYSDLPEQQKIVVLMVTGQVPKCFKSNRMDDELLLEYALRNIWNKLVEKNLV